METKRLKPEKLGRWPKLALALMIALQLVFFAVQGRQKVDFHMDEITQYNLANSYYSPFMWNHDDLFGTWHSGDYFAAAVTVDPAHRFAYDAVIENQRWDVHPPLSYLVLHTICSFMPGVFSKWQGIGLNMALFVAASLLLYALGRRLLKNDWLALAPCLWWGFSSGAASTVMFVRMYMLAAVFCLWSLHCGFALATREKWSKGLVFSAFLSAFLGFMTHYYYLLVLFFVYAAACLLFLLQKRARAVWKLGLVYLAAGAAGVAFFYSAVAHIFLGYRGTQSVGNLLDFSSWPTNLAATLGLLDKRMFGGLLLPFAIVVCVGWAVVLLARRMKKPKTTLDRQSRELLVAEPAKSTPGPELWGRFAMMLMLAAVVAGVVLTVSKIAPGDILQYGENGDRYLMMLLPMVALLGIALLQPLLQDMIGRAGACSAIGLGLAGVLAATSLWLGGINYQYRENAEAIQDSAALAEKGTVAVGLFLEKGTLAMHALPYIARYDRVFIATPDTIDLISEELAKLDPDAHVAFFAHSSWVDEKRFPAFREETGYNGRRRLLRKNTFYLFEMWQAELEPEEEYK